MGMSKVLECLKSLLVPQRQLPAAVWVRCWAAFLCRSLLSVKLHLGKAVSCGRMQLDTVRCNGKESAIGISNEAFDFWWSVNKSQLLGNKPVLNLNVWNCFWYLKGGFQLRSECHVDCQFSASLFAFFFFSRFELECLKIAFGTFQLRSECHVELRSCAGLDSTGIAPEFYLSVAIAGIWVQSDAREKQCHWRLQQVRSSGEESAIGISKGPGLLLVESQKEPALLQYASQSLHLDVFNFVWYLKGSFQLRSECHFGPSLVPGQSWQLLSLATWYTQVQWERQCNCLSDSVIVRGSNVAWVFLWSAN